MSMSDKPGIIGKGKNKKLHFPYILARRVEARVLPAHLQEEVALHNQRLASGWYDDNSIDITNPGEETKTIPPSSSVNWDFVPPPPR